MIVRIAKVSDGTLLHCKHVVGFFLPLADFVSFVHMAIVVFVMFCDI